MRGANARFWIMHAVLPLLLFCILAVLFEATDWDRALSTPFYDFAGHCWPAKHSFWAETLIHRGGRNLVAATGVGSLLAWGVSFFRPGMARWRRAALYLALCIALGAGSVALAKQLTNRHCPWDTDLFEGSVPYVKLCEPAPQGFKPGRGFPAGHAAGGFSLMGGYFLFYPRRRKAAFAGLCLGLGLGAVFGFGQVARGAHFVSHNLWSAVICWFVALLLFRFPFRGRLHSEGASLPLESEER